MKNTQWQELDITPADRANIKHQKACCIWMTGLSGSGKTTIANQLDKELHRLQKHTYILDGDNLRHGLNKDLGFSISDRSENIRRVAEVANLMIDAGLIVIVSFISPLHADRVLAKNTIGASFFYEVFINTPIEVCEKRDPKGLYQKARQGTLPNFTGIDSPYEPPEDADITISTTSMSPDDAVKHILELLRTHGHLN